MPRTVGVERNAALGAAVGINPPASAYGAYIQAEAQNIRVGTSTNVPTAAQGFIIKPGDPPLFIESSTLRSLRFIEAVAGGILNILYTGAT